jgi:hypothetical protein
MCYIEPAEHCGFASDRTSLKGAYSMRHTYRFPRTLAIITLFLVVLLSACSTTTNSTANNPPGQQPGLATATPTGLPTPTTPPAPTATLAPVANCSQVSGFGSAGAISAGSHFTEVGFPSSTVGFVKQTFEDNSYQFRIISACTNGTTVSAIRSYYASKLPSTGFAQSSTFPYQGKASSACGDPYCWYNGSAHPSFQASRYVSLEYVTAAGSVVIYNLRLSITPLGPNNITIPGTNAYDFDLVDNPDVNWSIITSTQREMEPLNGSTLANIGVTNFANVTAVQLEGLSYSSTPIDGNNDSSNELVNGDVWAVHTDGGHLVKVLVVSYGYNIVLNYIVYEYTF